MIVSYDSFQLHGTVANGLYVQGIKGDDGYKENNGEVFWDVRKHNRMVLITGTLVISQEIFES